MAMDVEVIWLKSEPEYFCEKGWTGFGDLPDEANRLAMLA
jgi:hypothetical protein